MPPLNTAEPATKRVGAGGGKLARNVRTDAAVDLDIDRTSRGHRPDVADLAERGADEGLAAEAGIDRHHQHEIDQVDAHIRSRSTGVPGLSETPAFLPSARIACSERCRCGPASAWTVM